MTPIEAAVNMITRSTSRLLAVAMTVAALTLAGGGIANAKPGGVPAIPLNNEQETGMVDTGASGFLSYDVSGTEFCYTLEVRNLSQPAVAGHIHVGARNAAGPVVIPLTIGAGTDWTVQTCVAASEALLANIAANPRDYYVNVHTPAFPGGEIRGQVK
ncbi:CHRD domain-containing protein [Cryobacterium sp. CG_9.6]|uniref:CHRD domain-containing protein n=1 Tax=Cryobacterium sp. CG_9.6 TaxID=2760710 RepID=UPI0024739C87|nr:CHRD domain-containing protein [Cryobacterium sp. CG_9.6]MDH6237779.1 hypothetical protein [Cryobacterium sp. CG_9.6]